MFVAPALEASGSGSMSDALISERDSAVNHRTKQNLKI